MLKENNKIRNELMLNEHKISPTLTKAAQDHAQYMAETGDFEHVSKNNGSPGIRAARYGYSGTVRENLGRAYKSVDVVFLEWTKSESHMKSITGDFTEVGFGYAVSKDGVGYWVALYGKQKKRSNGRNSDISNSQTSFRTKKLTMVPSG
jgi:uncharacterized protein YkwD